jgi:hypothetical protein
MTKVSFFRGDISDDQVNSGGMRLAGWSTRVACQSKDGAPLCSGSDAMDVASVGRAERRRQ